MPEQQLPNAWGTQGNPNTGVCDAMKVWNKTLGCNFAFIPDPDISNVEKKPPTNHPNKDEMCGRLFYGWKYMFDCVGQ
jgi:hypothetical protein